MRRRELDVHRERGRVPAQPLRADAELVHRAREALLELRALGIVAAGAQRARRGDLGEMHAKVGRAAQDRKSTRLNSSHSQISYAVFCLKKKKKKIKY